MQTLRAMLFVLLMGVLVTACSSEPTGPGPGRFDSSGLIGSGYETGEPIPSYSSGAFGSGY